MNQFINEFKSAVHEELQKEILANYGIDFYQWQNLVDSMNIVSHQLGIDMATYDCVLRDFHNAKKALDTMCS